ncbi:MAG: phosphate ABC transporter ATP-binding protein [Deltaproteobacteria bacterium]
MRKKQYSHLSMAVDNTKLPIEIANNDPFIRAEDLSVFYNGKSAVKNVSLPVMANSITALIGPSGSGKSSFLHALNRMTDLFQGCRVTGSIYFGDSDILSPATDVTWLRKKIGLIFQRPNPFPLSIRENIALPLKEHGVKDKYHVDHIIEKVLNDAGLWGEVKDRLKSPALSLSGGQQQRLCIARALSLEPDALLLDEPCSSLDPISGGMVEDLIKDFRSRYSVLIVTHNLAQARRISDFTALFWLTGGSGRLIEYAGTGELFTSPKNELTASYLEGIRG